MLTTADPDLVAYNLLVLAQAWAVKHWHYEQTVTFEECVRRQPALVLAALFEPDLRHACRHLLAG